MSESVPSKQHRSLPLSLLAKPVDSIIRKRSNSICYLHCLAGNSVIIFFSTARPLSVCKVYINSWSSTVKGVRFACRVMLLITCIQFRLFIKEYLTNWYKFWT